MSWNNNNRTRRQTSGSWFTPKTNNRLESICTQETTTGGQGGAKPGDMFRPPAESSPGAFTFDRCLKSLQTLRFKNPFQ